jgi:hypothetical protein
MLLKCKETQKWKAEFLNDKWLPINEETARKITISYNKITELRN